MEFRDKFKKSVPRFTEHFQIFNNTLHEVIGNAFIR